MLEVESSSYSLISNLRRGWNLRRVVIATLLRLYAKLQPQQKKARACWRILDGLCTGENLSNFDLQLDPLNLERPPLPGPLLQKMEERVAEGRERRRLVLWGR